MSYCAAQIVQLATTIFQGINSPPALSIGYISGWIIDSGNLGDLNNKLSICAYLTGDSPCLVGDFSADEAAIYQLCFNTDYYEAQSLAVLQAGSWWIDMSEGDAKVRRSDMVTVSKQFLALQDNSQKTLRLAIQDYKRTHTTIASVDGTCLPAYPSP